MHNWDPICLTSPWIFVCRHDNFSYHSHTFLDHLKELLSTVFMRPKTGWSSSLRALAVCICFRRFAARVAKKDFLLRLWKASAAGRLWHFEGGSSGEDDKKINFADSGTTEAGAEKKEKKNQNQTPIQWSSLKRDTCWWQRIWAQVGLDSIFKVDYLLHKCITWESFKTSQHWNNLWCFSNFGPVSPLVW